MVKKRKQSPMTCTANTMSKRTSDALNVDAKPQVSQGGDVTKERKRFEEELRESEARFRDVADLMPEPYYELDLDGNFTFASRSAFEKFGYTERDMNKGIHFLNILLPDSHDIALERMNEIRNGKPSQIREFTLKRKDGTTFPALVHLNPIVGKEGLKGWRGIMVDISEQKKAQEAQQKEQKQLQTIIDTIIDGLYVTSFEGYLLLANDAAARILGYQTKDEIIGLDVIQFIAPSDQQRVVNEALHAYREGRSIERLDCRYLTVDGREIEGEFSCAPILDVLGMATGWVIVSRDITERNHVAEALRQSEEKYRLLAEHMGDFVTLTDLKGVITYASPSHRKLGYAPDDIVGKGGGDLVHPEDYLRLANELTQYYNSETITKTIATDGIIPETRLHYRAPDIWGNIHYLEAVTTLIIDPSGKNHQVLHISRDVTQQKLADEALKVSERKYKLLADNTADYIVVTDLEGNIQYASPSFWKLGYEPDDLIGKSALPMIHPDDRLVINAKVPDRIEISEKTNLDFRNEIRIFDKQGNIHYIESSSTRFQSIEDDTDRVLTVARDVTERKQTEQQLEKYRQHLEEMVEERTEENSALTRQLEFIIGTTKTELDIIDADFRIRYIDPESLKNYGNPQGKRCYEYFMNSSTVCQSCGVIQALQTKEAFVTEQSFPLKGDSTYQIKSMPFQDKDGEWLVAQVKVDISERRQMEEELRKAKDSAEASVSWMRAVYEQAADSIYVVDTKARIRYVNPKACQELGYTRKELLTMTIADIDPEFQSKEEEKCFWETMPKDKSFKLEVNLNRKQGSKVPFEIVFSRVDILDGTYLVGIGRNLEERKKAEEELLRANIEFARADRMKDEFLANMSHELRTPLNAVMGMSEALQEEVYGSLNEKQMRSLKVIEESGGHLLELINDILDVAKIGAGKLDIEIHPVEVESVCEASLRLIKETAQKKRLKISSYYDSSVISIKGDARHLKQVLVNLLSNAVKFTPEGGEVGLEVKGDCENGVVRITVWDTGIGISPENMKLLFQPFVQIDSSLSRQYNGTGLGLALVDRLTKMHGGSVSVKSEENVGSRFIVTLPWDSQLLSCNEPGDTEFIHQINNAMIIEDSTDAAQQITRYLERMGISVTTHEAGEGALEKAAELLPDVIIMDILLPGISGWEVLRQLKENPATVGIPVIIVSVVDERTKGKEMGAAEYLVKPVSYPQIEHVVKRLTGKEIKVANAMVVSAEKTGCSSNAITVLVVDDNEESNVTVSNYLLAKGFGVIVARSGMQAIELALEKHPDLILMDVQMPEMDGLEAIRHIRSDERLADIPIIALTALAMQNDRERAIEAGADEYLSKPIRLKELVDQMYDLVSSSRVKVG